jgi:hypothetical protein
LADFAMADRQRNVARLEQLRALRDERFELMDRLAHLPSDMVFFTQITMEAAEDTAFLDGMRRANIKGALVGVEAVTPEGRRVDRAPLHVPRPWRPRPWLFYLRTAE